MASAMMETANDLANDTQPLDDQARGTIRALTSRTPAADPPYQVLNPCTIGRPVHLIDKFTARLRADLEERFCLPLNRRYCAGFEIADVSLVHSSAQPEAAPRWRHYRTATGRVDVAVDRDLLLGILHFRYGTPGSPTDSPAASAPVSAGEERLAAALSEQLIAIVTGRIEGPTPAATPESVGKESHSGFAQVGGDAPIEDAWSLQVEIAERTRRFHGPVLLAGRTSGASLDHAMWFHRPFRADRWLLYAQDSPVAHGARGLAHGEVFTAEGELVVSVMQEGLIRATPPPGPRPGPDPATTPLPDPAT